MRPLVPADINPIVVVSSSLSGMWKPLLSFQRRTGARAVALGLDDRLFSSVRPRKRKGTFHVHAYAYLTLSAFRNAAQAHSGSFVPYSSVPALLHLRKHTHCTSPLFPSCSRVCQPLVVWEVGFPGGTAQVAVMSLERSASRTICPGFCTYFIYVMVHLVNTTLPATHLLITTC